MICIDKDIEEYIRAYARKNRIPIGKYEAYRQTVRDGLKVLGLNPDLIDMKKFIAIAKRKDAQALAKQQEGLNDKGNK